MKYFWSFSLFFICSIAFSQSDTLNDYQCYGNFSDAEKIEWTAFKNNWNYVHHNAILKKQHIKKLNCANCESFYAEIYMEINAEGKITFTQIDYIKKCGILNNDKLLALDYLNSLKNYAFKSVKNKKFVVRFGSVLKC